jgi:RNA polymerase sigma-70 factor, ECF subfamily
VTLRAVRQDIQGPPPGQAADERELLASVARGDQHAFKRLYLIYHRRLGGFLMRMTGRLDLTEELINDIMFVVWKKADSFRGESQVSTWIMGIAYRQALKALRRSRAAPWAGAAARSHEQRDLPAADGTEQQEMREWIDRALAGLPAKQRMVIELAYFMGYSCEEISRLAGCPVGTVKTRMHSARIRLRALMPKLSAAGPAAPGGETP